MGCIHSKNRRVGPAPVMEEEAPDPAPGKGTGQETTGATAEDGRKSAVAYEVSLEGRQIDGLIRQHPPKKLKRLEPQKDIALSAEALLAKQRLAEENRERVSKRRLKSARATRERLSEIAKMRESLPKPTTDQLDKQLEAAQRMREVRQSEIVEKQRLREERAKQARQRREEPLDEGRLAAHVKLEPKEDNDYYLSFLKRPETPKHMTKRQMALLNESRTQRNVSIDSISAQLEAAQKAREARQKEVVEKQRLRAERAKQVRERRLEPLSENCLAADIAIDRKEKALRSKENIQKNMELLSKRRREFAKSKEFEEHKREVRETQSERKVTDDDVKDRPSSAKVIQRSEPLSENCLAADIAIDRKEKALRSKENIQKNMELLSKRRREFAKSKEFEEHKREVRETQSERKVTDDDVKDRPSSAKVIQVKEAETKKEFLEKTLPDREIRPGLDAASVMQLMERGAGPVDTAEQIEQKLREAELKREHLKNEIILKQRLRAVKATQVRRRAKKRSEDQEELPEIECDGKRRRFRME